MLIIQTKLGLIIIIFKGCQLQVQMPLPINIRQEEQPNKQILIIKFKIYNNMILIKRFKIKIKFNKYEIFIPVISRLILKNNLIQYFISYF